MVLKLFRKIVMQNATATRCYYRRRIKKPTLYSKISPLGNSTSVVPELDDWVYRGSKVRVAELQRIIRDLRKCKRFSQALEISEWMYKNGVCIFSPTEHAVHLDLIGKVHGFLSAESYFNSLKDQEQTYKTYGALLYCYVRQCQTDKSLAHLRKMKELGFAWSPLPYNDIMSLYTKIGQHEKVPYLLTEMRKNKVLPDNFSYRICINSYGMMADIDGMERTLTEMEGQSHILMDWNTYAVVANYLIKAGLTHKAVDALKKSEARLDEKDALGYNHLISLYASLGEKTEVIRLWNLEKSARKSCTNRDFTTMLEALARLGELDEAEKVLKEWESSGNCYEFRIPNTVISGYSQKGLHEKAEAMLEDLQEEGKATSPNNWTAVADRYLHEGEMENALRCLKVALSLYVENKRWKPNPKLILRILNWLGDKGSVQDVETLVGSLRVVIPVNIQMYNALIKAYIRGCRKVDCLLERMKNDEIDEDEETKEILNMKH